LTQVNFITENEMPRNTYLYENRVFTNKVRCSIILGQKEKALGARRTKAVQEVLALIAPLDKLGLFLSNS